MNTTTIAAAPHTAYRIFEPRDFVRNVMTAAITNKGIDSITVAHRSPNCGKRRKLVRSGPRIAPVIFAAYADPARSGSPIDNESTSKGVMKPAYPQKKTIEPRRKLPS